MGVTPGARLAHKIRMNEVANDELEKKRKEEKKKRLEAEYSEMRKVVNFFFENCPYDLSEQEKNHIEQTLFNGRGSRSKHGTINFLAEVSGYRWPDWSEKAKNEFGINY